MDMIHESLVLQVSSIKKLEDEMSQNNGVNILI